MLDISVSDGDSGPVLLLAGEADLTTLAQLNSALNAQILARPRLLTVDASRLLFADTAAIAALVAAARTVRDQGGQLELRHPRPAVARTLELTGASRVLTVRGEPGSEHEPALDRGEPPPGLRVLVGSAGGDVVLRLADAIDVTTVSVAIAAAERCLRDRPARMTIDLCAVTFCDVAGGRALRHAQQQAAAAGTGFRLTGLTAPVRRSLALMRATSLLRVADEPAGRAAAVGAGVGNDAQTETNVMPPVPPAPAPDAVSAARGQLNELYASGVERLLWELDKQPIADTEAIRRAIAAVGNGEEASVGPALVLLQAARLGLDRLEASAFDTAYAAGISDETLAAILGLPAAAAAAWHQWLTARHVLPYDEPSAARHVVPGGPADAVARAGRCVHQAASRTVKITQRLEQLSAPGEGPRPRREHAEHAEHAAAHAGEARITAGEAAERATLGLLRAAEALEQCAASYEQLASADQTRKDEHRREAARYWYTAHQYRQLAEQQYRPSR